MTPGELAFESVERQAHEWGARHGCDGWMLEELYVRAILSAEETLPRGWSCQQMQTASLAAQHTWKSATHNTWLIRAICGLVPCLVAILGNYLQLGFPKDQYLKWLVTSVVAAIGALVVSFEALGGKVEDERAATWKALAQDVSSRMAISESESRSEP